MLEFAEIKRAATGQWGWILPALGVAESYLRARHGPCPGCPGGGKSNKDRFRFPDRDAGEWFCGGGGNTTGGDGFGLLGHVHGWPVKECFARVAEVLGLNADRQITEAERARWAEERAAAERREAARLEGLATLQELDLLAAVLRRRWGDEPGPVASAPVAVDERARRIWGQAAETGTSSYLERKQIGGHGVRYKDPGLVVVPVRDLGGRLVGLQFIGEDGKKFLSGTPKRGGLHLFGGLEARPEWEADPEGKGGRRIEAPVPEVICIGEGYATVATVAEARPDWGAVVAFDCGNLAAVARAVSFRWPSAWVVVLGDYDMHEGQEPGEPGVSAAVAAAEGCGGVAIWPQVPDGQAWDWSDVLVRWGRPEVDELLAAGLATAKRDWGERVREAAWRARQLLEAQYRGRP